MKKILMGTSILSLTIFAILSCSNQLSRVSNDLEERFKAATAVKDMNESIQLKVNGEDNIFPRDAEIPLIIANRSPHSIFFATDSHIKLLIIENGEWEEVKNEFTYSGLLVISPQGTPLLESAITWVQPEMSYTSRSTNETELLRIVVIGELMENDNKTGEFVGAYVDVYLSP